jgi:hypothetical protein
LIGIAASQPSRRKRMGFSGRPFVMAWLVPALHVPERCALEEALRRNGVDARDTPGHDSVDAGSHP